MIAFQFKAMGDKKDILKRLLLEFLDLNLAFEILDKKKLHPRNSIKFYYTQLEFSRPKTKTHGNST